MYDVNGNPILSFGKTGDINPPAPNWLFVPSNIAVDGNGNVFVADNGNGRIVEFNVTGLPLAL